MQKEIRVLNKEKQIVRITTLDERWYARPAEEPVTGLPTFKFYPSSTWIAGCYPKGIGFYKWLADKGWDEAEAIKQAAGNRGSKVHQALELIESTGELPLEAVFMNHDTSMAEQLGTQEIECLFTFTKWHNETKPELIASEMTVFGDGYAGTLDRIYRINGVIWIVDFKTSQQIWEEMKLQVSSYNHAEIDFQSLGITEVDWQARKIGILQLGYRLNKNGYKFTEVEDKFELFTYAQKIWANENGSLRPRQRDYPLTLTLNQGAQNVHTRAS